MGDLHAPYGQQQQFNGEKQHLGLGVSRAGYGDSTTKFGSDGGLLLGLGQGAKAQAGNGAPFPVVDEGSSTARLTSGGYMPSLLMGSHIYPTVASDRHRSDFRGKERMDEGLVEHDLLYNLRASASGGTTSTSGASGSDRAPKVCKFRGCGKGPRGASGLCIAHGGGRSAGVKSMGATKVRKGERSTAKHTEEAGGAKTWVALKVPKARQISV